ncbi:MAG TPA: cytochrome c [Candidatus Acidoferrum sp.]|jgi:mono/diheme cytochrome c family protein
MNDKKQRSLRMRKILLACTLVLIFISIGLGAFHKTQWIVPPDEKARKNPLTTSEANITAAKKIYEDRCVNCHGDTGKGDGSEAMMYDPAPADLTDAAQMSKVTDGEIYYQITQGRKPMPSFKNRLTENERWQLVLLVRSFAANPANPSPAKSSEAPAEKKPASPPSNHK